MKHILKKFTESIAVNNITDGQYVNLQKINPVSLSVADLASNQYSNDDPF